MRLFPSKKKPLSDKQRAIAEKVAGRIVQAQHRLADRLNRRTAEVPTKTWFVLLIVFCAAFGSYSLYLLLQAF